MDRIQKEKIFVTGAAGFIGSHLVGRLLRNGSNVIGFDNLSSGKLENMKQYIQHSNFEFVKGDLSDKEAIRHSIKDSSIIFHLAANPEVKIGYKDTYIDLNQNIICTHNLLEAIRTIKTPKVIVFTSTSTVYGESKIIPTPESYAPLLPISNYGASKLGCEGFVSSYCHLFGIRGLIFRFANIVGSRGHGVVKDFIEKLRRNPRELQILGDGNQTKSYLLVDDCIDAFLVGLKEMTESISILNVGSEDQITVRKIADIIIGEMGLDVKKIFIEGEDGRGWRGDVKNMYLSIEKLKSLGWNPRHNSDQSIRLAAQDFLNEL